MVHNQVNIAFNCVGILRSKGISLISQMQSIKNYMSKLYKHHSWLEVQGVVLTDTHRIGAVSPNLYWR